VISSGRHRRTCDLLEAGKSRLTPADLRAALRDHYESGSTYRPGHTADDERCYSVCMHADPVGTTTASMMARLPAGDGDIVTYWASLASPCLGIFVPLYVEAEIPSVLARGGEQATADSPWWRSGAAVAPRG
jgi:dipeptidase